MRGWSHAVHDIPINKAIPMPDLKPNDAISRSAVKHYFCILSKLVKTEKKVNKAQVFQFNA
jgi:hypothetical protein